MSTGKKPWNVPGLPAPTGDQTFMATTAASSAQLAYLKTLIRKVGDWPTQEDDLATILGGYRGPLSGLSQWAASYLIVSLQQGLVAITAAEEAL